MKIAVKNNIGIQDSEDGKLENYFSVPDTFEFEGSDSMNVTSVPNLNLFLRYFRIDLITLRQSIKLHLLSDWNSLSEYHSYLISIYIYPDTVTQSTIDSFFTAAEQIENWTSLVNLTRKARANRWDISRQKISFQLSQFDLFSLYNLTKGFKDDFIEANLPIIILWITSGANESLGVDFSETGFAAQSYYSEDRKNLLLDVLLNGN